MQHRAPYKRLITHGFCLDEKGRKMSKSIGNTVVPHDFIQGVAAVKPEKGKKKQPAIPAYGVDVLRYWVASTDYTKDVSIGSSVVAEVSDALRKVRNTARFLLAKLNGFDPTTDRVPYDRFASIDQYMLHLLTTLRYVQF